jgi:hypothetical protein
MCVPHALQERKHSIERVNKTCHVESLRCQTTSHGHNGSDDALSFSALLWVFVQRASMLYYFLFVSSFVCSLISKDLGYFWNGSLGY